MANTRIVTKFAGIDKSIQTVQDVAEQDYYLFAAKHMPFTGNDSITSTITNSIDSLVFNVYDQMLFGKRVQLSDVALMISRNTWVSGTVYTMYDDRQLDLYNTRFFVSVQDGSLYYIYKCIDNNRGAPSTSAPSGTATSTIMAADNYQWKYMFTVDSTNHTRFATSNYLPVIANTTIQQTAIDGSIETIKIDVAGAGYDNYIENASFSSADIRIGGSDLQYTLPSTASDIDRFYEDCLIKITSGAGENQYRRIISYVGATRLAIIDTGFSPVPSNGDSYDVYPLINVFNNGYTDSVNCIARAVITANTGNSVSMVEILNVGAGYKAATAVILPGNTVGVQVQADLRAVISPPGGHGYDTATELGASKVCFRTTFNGSEGGFIPSNNDFRTVGILKNPYLDNVILVANNGIGSFVVGETVYQYKQRLLSEQVTVSSNSTVTGTATSFTNQLSPSDYVIVTNGSSSFFTRVASVTNSTSFATTTNSTFSGANCSLYYVDTVRFGQVTAKAANAVTLTNVSLANRTPSFLYVGETSSATLVANAVYHNEKTSTNNFFSFVQLHRFVGDLNSGTFNPDDTVSQSTALPQVIPTGQVFDLIVGGGANDDILYVSNVHNIFDTNSSISSSSGGSFNLSYKYTGDLVKDSGKVLYLENFQPLTRNTSTTETIKLILEF